MIRPERVQAAFEVVAKGSDPGKTGKEMMDYVLALEAENERLRRLNANLMGDDEDLPRYTTKRLKLEIAKRLEPIEAENNRLWAALQDIALECDTGERHPDGSQAGVRIPSRQAVARLRAELKRR